MLEFLTVAGTSLLVKEVLGPLTKDAAKDFYKDFLKQSASDALLKRMPELLKKAIAHSQNDFLELFAEELEYFGLPGELINHEFAKPLKQFLADPEVRAFLGSAFDFDTTRLDRDFLRFKWEMLTLAKLPDEFDWETLTKNYLRRVKVLIRQDIELARQLNLDAQVRTEADTATLLGIKVDFNLKAYQESLKEKYGRLSLDSLDSSGAAYNDLRLWSIFVPQDVRECAEFTPQMYELPKERLAQLKEAGEIEDLLSLETVEQRRKSYAEQPVESVQGIVGLKDAARQPRTVILGDPGSGKSTLLQAMALGWAEQPVGALKGKPLPILIELRLYAQDKDKCNSFLEYLHEGNTFCHLNQREMDTLLKSGEVVALFDGVDEVFDPKLREAVVNDIHRFSNSYPAVQMVVTSRWLGYKAETLRNADFKHYMLQDLSNEQIDDFVEKWHGLTFNAGQKEERTRKQARLQKAIADSKPIRELAGNPLLLTMMAILNRNQELSRDRARLYERASEVLLYQWDVERKVHELPELKNWQIDVRDKQAMLRKVAHYMQTNEQGLSGNVISRKDLEQILTDYLKTLEVDRARVVARIMIEQLWERSFILYYQGADNYSFVHQTFLEYFCASEIVWLFSYNQTVNLHELKELFLKYSQDESWHEILRLVTSMIEPTSAGQIVEYLMKPSINRVDFVASDGCLNSKNARHLILASDCFSEIRGYRKASELGAQLLARLKQEIECELPYHLNESTALALIERIGDNWGNGGEALPWLKRVAESDESGYLKIAVSKVLATEWKKDTVTLLWLKKIAKEDKDSYVRIAILKIILDEWMNKNRILIWLRNIARNDGSANVRLSIIKSLSRKWKCNYAVISIIQERVIEDENFYVRQAAK